MEEVIDRHHHREGNGNSLRKIAANTLSAGATQVQKIELCHTANVHQMIGAVAKCQASSVFICASVSFRFRAATFSSRCGTDDVPGIGSITGECARSQAIAT